MEARLGRVTGTRLEDLAAKRGGGRKIGFYEIIAERIAIPASGENPMDRGTRLEDDAIARFIEETGKKVKNELVIWSREDEENIAISPDGFIEKKTKKGVVITEAVECKCLASARHLEAFLTQKIPSDYEMQVLQYFIVNEDLQTLHFVFYDPRMPRDFFWIDVTRKSVKEKVDEYLEIERQALIEITAIENQLTF